MIKIAPSILSADFLRLGEELKTVEEAEYVHFDVMDGVFVPNISFGLPILEQVRKATDKFLDVHLMITQPQKYVERFCAAGADMVVFHLEAAEPEDIHAAIDAVKTCGKKVGLALKPKTPAGSLAEYLNDLDMVLVMTVEPGFGGQRFMADMMPKVKAVREMIDRSGRECDLEVDGGVNIETAKTAVLNGANVLVAGSSIFKAADRKNYITCLRG